MKFELKKPLKFLSLGTPPRTILADKSLRNLKDSIANNEKFHSSELHEKIKILAQKVAKFFQTTDECVSHNFSLHLRELKFKFASSVLSLGSVIYGNSFEAALLFKALADQFDIAVTFVVASCGCRAWNETCNGANIVDLIFDVGEIYARDGEVARKYLQKIT